MTVEKIDSLCKKGEDFPIVEIGVKIGDYLTDEEKEEYIKLYREFGRLSVAISNLRDELVDLCKTRNKIVEELEKIVQKARERGAKL